MRFKRTFALCVLFVGAAFAQTSVDELRSEIGGVHYPRLAEAARVQGDVHLSLNSGVVTMLSGPPLLVQTAVESAKTFGSILGEGDVDVTYHFGFVNSATSGCQGKVEMSPFGQSRNVPFCRGL